MIEGGDWSPLMDSSQIENGASHVLSTIESNEFVVANNLVPDEIVKNQMILPCNYRLKCAFARCLKDIYFWACIVYLVYTCQALAVDYCEYVKIYENQCEILIINNQFIALAAVHVFNAFQFLACWIPFMKETEHLQLSKATKFKLLLPEFMNIIEGCMYLLSALSYQRIQNNLNCQTDLKCRDEMFLHHWETSAASVECFASLLWCYSWYFVFNIDIMPYQLNLKDKVIWALFDPELYSAILLVIGSIVYIVYYLQVDEYPNHYDTNMLWEVGDVIYFIGAVLYLISSMKLCGCFYFVTWLPGWLDDWQEIDEANYMRIFNDKVSRQQGSFGTFRNDVLNEPDDRSASTYNPLTTTP